MVAAAKIRAMIAVLISCAVAVSGLVVLIGLVILGGVELYAVPSALQGAQAAAAEKSANVEVQYSYLYGDGYSACC